MALTSDMQNVICVLWSVKGFFHCIEVGICISGPVYELSQFTHKEFATVHKPCSTGEDPDVYIPEAYMV